METMWIMITVVAGLGSCIPIVAIWTKNQKDIAELELAAKTEVNAERAAQYDAQNAEIIQRLQVLETIVTDKGFDVANEIEALRQLQQPIAIGAGDHGAGVPLNLAKEKA